MQTKLQNCKRGLKLSDNQINKTSKSVLQMQTKCKGFLQKSRPYFCNALIFNLMCKFFKLYEKCVFFARFAHFFAKTPLSYSLSPIICTKCEKRHFSLLLHFCPIIHLFWDFKSAFSAFSPQFWYKTNVSKCKQNAKMK